MIVHHLNNSRSQRILWLLEELGAPYTIKHYQRDPRTMLAPPELRSIHPLGKSPVLTDGNLTLAESGAIIEYLCERFGKLGSSDRQRFIYWLHYAEGSLMPPLLVRLITGVIRRKSPWPVRPIANAIAAKIETGFVDPNVKTHLGFIEGELSKATWFCGDAFSAADIMMSFPLEAAAARHLVDSSYPKILAFLERIHARPAYQLALSKGGPYDLLN